MSLHSVRSVGLAVLASGLILSSCQSTQIKPGSEKIRIFEAEPKGCLFMGEVSSVQDNEEIAVKSADPDMTLKTRIDLRNKAFVLNANVLVFTPKNKAKIAAATAPVEPKNPKDPKAAQEATPYIAPSDANVKMPAESVFLGTAFRCPPLIFNQ